MSNDLLEFLLKIQIAVSDDIYSYVYFDKQTGKIEKISSNDNQIDDCKSIKVKHSSIDKLVSGEHRLEDYRVLYNPKIKDFEISKLQENTNLQNVNNSLLKISKSATADKENFDVVIEQNNKKECWNFYINKNINFLENVNDVMCFSITESNDPNVLYRTIMFNVSSLIDNFISVPYVYDSEKDIKNVSVFTNKVLDTYAHEVIDDWKI